jgi:hypothetical protein
VELFQQYRVGHVVIAGGEPTIAPGLLDLLWFIHQQGDQKIPFRIITNGSNLNREWIDFLLKTHSWVNVSLNAWDPKSHEEITKVPGMFDRVVNNISTYLQQAGPSALCSLSAIIDEPFIRQGGTYKFIDNILSLWSPYVSFLAFSMTPDNWWIEKISSLDIELSRTFVQDFVKSLQLLEQSGHLRSIQNVDRIFPKLSFKSSKEQSNFKTWAEKYFYKTELSFSEGEGLSELPVIPRIKCWAESHLFIAGDNISHCCDNFEEKDVICQITDSDWSRKYQEAKHLLIENNRKGILSSGCRAFCLNKF